METSFVENLSVLFIRDIQKIGEEIKSYKSEDILWKSTDQVANSGGNLALHLIGNLNHFIGAILGKSSYVRQRDLEFNSKNIPREKILADLLELKSLVEKVIPSIDSHVLNADFPQQIGGITLKTKFFILHLYSHLNYHLGQINYHRRLLDK